MTDATPTPASRPGGAPGGRPPAPRWVKITLALVLVAIVAVVAMRVFGGEGMQHGPGRHGQGPIGPSVSGYAAESPVARPATP